MPDIYQDSGRTYNEKVTKKVHFQTLPFLEISLAGATEYTVVSEVEYRPDLVSLENYGTIDYDDYVTIANKLDDPIKGYKTGTVLYLPTVAAIREAIDEA